ncbi:GPP34 family phosphoprotein [Actinoplanes missouriensis]|uniref:GOLPH3/VPS74 family protein n=1 Tax=Actinoplanes missouriensis TaxID=1866 RepID=UPI0033DB1ECF
MNLLDEFMLLAHDQLGRRIADTSRLDYALGGAILMELALAGRIDVADKKVVVIDRDPLGDPIVDAALIRIGDDPKGRTAGHWVTGLSKGVQRQVLDRLVTDEILRVERSKVMVVFPRVRYPWAYDVEPPARASARERMRSAIHGTWADPRTHAMCSLIAAVEIERKLFPDLDRKLLKARLRELSEGEWAAAAVRKAIQAVQAAVTTAVVVDASSGGDGGGGGGGGT